MEVFLAKVVAWIIVAFGLLAGAALEIAPLIVAKKRSLPTKSILKVLILEVLFTPLAGFVAAFLMRPSYAGKDVRTEKGKRTNKNY